MKVGGKTGCGLVLAAVLLWALLAAAPVAAAAQEGPRRPLSALELDKFMVDWPRFVAWAREHGVEFDRPDAPDAIFEEILEREAAGFIKSMGWETARFNYVLERISALLSGLMMADQRERIEAAHKAERIDIENNPDLTESERAQQLQTLDQSWKRMEEFGAELERTDPGELELIRTNREKLMELIKKVYKGY